MFVAHSYGILQLFKLHYVPVRPNIDTARVYALTIIQYYSIALNVLLLLLMDWDLVVVTNGHIGGFIWCSDHVIRS